MADPGFPRGGVANPKGGGFQPIIWPIFPKNCMKMKTFWARDGGARVPHAPLSLDPPLIVVFKQKQLSTDAVTAVVFIFNTNLTVCQSMPVSHFQTLIKSCSIDSRNDPTSV